MPLAERMRPQVLSEFVGQKHIIGKNMLLWRAISMGEVGSCIFYGPPGTGKTTLANIIAKNLNGNFRKLNAVSSGVADAKEIINEARKNKMQYGTQTYLLLDECHRWSKAQSDSVLSAIEDGSIIFIGSTTENPYTSMTRAIVSRCRVFEFKHIEDKDVIECLKRAIEDKQRGFGNMQNLVVEDKALKHFAWASAGDVRMALNSLELAVVTTDKNAQGNVVVSLEVAEQSIQKKALSIDDTQYYDMLSCFCKSIRGSDADAALHAIGESILGALALGDLGTYFPPSNNEFKDKESSYFVIKIVKMMKEKGYQINNVDVSILAEAPRLAPYILLMRENVALLLETPIDNVSIKAGTNEKMDAVGRKEAIEATSIVMLKRI